MGKKKKAEHLTLKTSVKSYQGDIGAEKQKMGDYAKKMSSSVRSLQKEFKIRAKEMKEAGRKMIEEGNRKMNALVKNQISENREAVSRIGNGVKMFLSEVNKKKKDFRAYQQAFWG